MGRKTIISVSDEMFRPLVQLQTLSARYEIFCFPEWKQCCKRHRKKSFSGVFRKWWSKRWPRDRFTVGGFDSDLSHSVFNHLYFIRVRSKVQNERVVFLYQAVRNEGGIVTGGGRTHIVIIGLLLFTGALHVWQTFNDGTVFREINLISWSNCNICIVRVVLFLISKEIYYSSLLNTKVFISCCSVHAQFTNNQYI